MGCFSAGNNLVLATPQGVSLLAGIHDVSLLAGIQETSVLAGTQRVSFLAVAKMLFGKLRS
jgi:hypothetical protein